MSGHWIVYWQHRPVAQQWQSKSEYISHLFCFFISLIFLFFNHSFSPCSCSFIDYFFPLAFDFISLLGVLFLFDRRQFFFYYFKKRIIIPMYKHFKLIFNCFGFFFWIFLLLFKLLIFLFLIYFNCFSFDFLILNHCYYCSRVSIYLFY